MINMLEYKISMNKLWIVMLSMIILLPGILFDNIISKLLVYGSVMVLSVKYSLKNVFSKANKFWFFLSLYIILVLVELIINYVTIDQVVLAVKQYYYGPLFLLSILCLCKNIKPDFLKKCYMVCGGLNSVMAIIQYTFQNNFIFERENFVYLDDADAAFRACGFIGSPMTAGTVIAVCAITAFDAYIKKRNIIYLLLFLVMLLGLVLTFSRGPWVAFVIGFLVYILFQFKNNMMNIIKKNHIMLLAFVIIVIMLTQLNNIEGISQFYSSASTISDFEDNKSNALRLFFWLNAISIIISDIGNFIFGVGLATTGSQIREYPFIFTVTESGVLKRWVEGGLLIFAVYYSMLYQYYKCYIYQKLSLPDMDFTISVLIVILVEDCVLQVTESATILYIFWSCIAYGIILSSKKRGISRYE